MPSAMVETSPPSSLASRRQRKVVAPCVPHASRPAVAPPLSSSKILACPENLDRSRLPFRHLHLIVRSNLCVVSPLRRRSRLAPTSRRPKTSLASLTSQKAPNPSSANSLTVTSGSSLKTRGIPAVSPSELRSSPVPKTSTQVLASMLVVMTLTLPSHQCSTKSSSSIMVMAKTLATSQTWTIKSSIALLSPQRMPP